VEVRLPLRQALATMVSNDDTVDAAKYWELRLSLCDDPINEVALLVHLRRGALPRPQVGEVVSVQVTGAGSEVANGVFVRDGVYTGFAGEYRTGAPLFKNGEWWMIRYRMPSGSFRWYISDSRTLGREVGDLYYTISCAAEPPTDRPWRQAKAGAEPVPRMRSMRGPPRPVGPEVADASPLVQLVERQTDRLNASGVDVSPLLTPLVPLGALASIDVRTGRFVDRIVLRRHHTSTTGTGSYSSPTDALSGGSYSSPTDALSGGSSIGKNEGGALSGGSSTGKNEEPVETSFELHSAEAVIGVCHWSSADYLGSQIEILTSEGRTCMFKGSRSSRRLSSLCVRAFTTSAAALSLGSNLPKWQYRGGSSAAAAPDHLTPGDEGEIVGFRISTRPPEAETGSDEEEDATAHQARSLAEVCVRTADGAETWRQTWVVDWEAAQVAQENDSEDESEGESEDEIGSGLMGEIEEEGDELEEEEEDDDDYDDDDDDEEEERQLALALSLSLAESVDPLATPAPAGD